MRMNLVQRGAFSKNLGAIKNTIEDKVKLFGSNPYSIIDLDYMGSAEYEFGACQKSLNDIFSDFPVYVLTQIGTTPNGVPVNLFAPTDNIEEITSELQCFVDYNKPDMISSYRLKEGICYQDIMNNFMWSDKSYNKYALSKTFWWDIVNNFMWFTGADDRQSAFMRAMNLTYDRWTNNIELHERQA